MSTLFTDVFERFASKVKDYTLDTLYTSSVSNYNTYLKGFLLNAIPKFTECVTDISDRNDTTMVFNNTLTESEEEILANMMVLEWTGREVNKLENLQRTLGDGDFKLHSGANSLREARLLKESTQEEIDNALVTYSWNNLDFDEEL